MGHHRKCSSGNCGDCKSCKVKSCKCVERKVITCPGFTCTIGVPTPDQAADLPVGQLIVDVGTGNLYIIGPGGTVSLVTTTPV